MRHTPFPLEKLIQNLIKNLLKNCPQKDAPLLLKLFLSAKKCVFCARNYGDSSCVVVTHCRMSSLLLFPTFLTSPTPVHRTESEVVL